MKFLKPRFWSDKNNLIVFLLIPFSFLFYLLTILKKKITVEKKFKIPVICIGNIYVGGTGKTPTSVKIVNDLKIKKKNPVIIKKYYKTHKDEHMMVGEMTGNLIIRKSRVKAIEEAEKENFNVAILDDGFQDHSIKKNLNIVCFNSKQLIGNGFVFPSGPLREGINSLKRAQIVIINGVKNKSFEEKILNASKEIKIFYSKYIPKNIEQFKNKKIFAFAGIGNPNNFFDLLYNSNIDVKKTIAFPDHYEFKAEEIRLMNKNAIKNNCELITTEKDFYRIKDFDIEKIGYLKIDLEIEENDRLVREIEKFL